MELTHTVLDFFVSVVFLCMSFLSFLCDSFMYSPIVVVNHEEGDDFTLNEDDNMRSVKSVAFFGKNQFIIQPIVMSLFSNPLLCLISQVQKSLQLFVLFFWLFLLLEPPITVRT